MIDRVELTLKGGDGGNGVVSFRREKFVPRGGPDGGDGGAGADVVITASRSVRTLKELGRRRIYRADRGSHGQGSDKAGRRGKKLELKVPVGTLITIIGDDGEEKPLGDLTSEGRSVIAAAGGMGGWGNARFTTSVHRAPRIAQRGQLGQERRVRLDLKLLADIGLVGLPNAGKSTLLAAMSAARPRVGAYPFTTLEPSLGVVDVGWQRFVVADIPGLIEGAHEGAGLGLDFLRHVERTRLLVHLIDGGNQDPWADMLAINRELSEYGQGLQGRQQIVALNKVDMVEVAERRGELEALFRKGEVEPVFISAAGGEGVEDLVKELAHRLKEMDEAEAALNAAKAEEEPPPPVVRPDGRPGSVTIDRQDGAYHVAGERAVAFAEMMPLEIEEGRAELWRRFGLWGVVGALKRAGAKRGDRIVLGSVELELEA
ncbi:MAG: GTPase ObgE [Chloroflexi bacterium]|nr:GTPase ObgE [Chloroflexota bacterium]MCI0817942.1 GTPase ObgE [Chloroflexota bacterium]MCI0819780.1 GTPase ObgE [Chloroflexota bacterium]MCI0831746.1 GTPase ObgE [Chloroflexota bacterium]MCI0838620.1 GTPase ObgE [Chloroflexota bacterium]